MIKLFWNTHNQSTLNLNIPNSEESVNHKWGRYHKDNSDKWIYEILNKIEFKVIEKEADLEKDDILIIIDSSIEKKIKFYEKLKLICSKIFLIHLGDETGKHDLSPVYENCNYIWRTFCSSKYFNNKKVSCIPIGYKSGISIGTKTESRKYKWAFIGTPHKSSRHDLLYQLSSIKPSFSYKTRKFNEKIIEVNEMSKILPSTKFTPCPNGFVHPETYRLYESLECECVPIVEKSYNYYDRLFPNNPFIKVEKWIEARDIIKNFDDKQIKDNQEKCIKWWSDYKNYIQKIFKDKIQ